MANATVIKLTNNGGTTLLPISDSAYIQHRWTTGWDPASSQTVQNITSVQDALNDTIDRVDALEGPIHTPGSDNQNISYNTTDGIVLSSNNSKGGGNIKLAGSTGVSISYTNKVLTFSAHNSGSDNQHLSASNVETNKIDVSLNGSGGKVTFEGNKSNAATSTYAYVGLSYTSGGSVLIEVSYTDTKYSQGTGISISGTTINHSNSVTGATVGPAGNKTLDLSGSTFAVPKITFDAQGHITSASTITYTMPTHSTPANNVTGNAAWSKASYIVVTNAAPGNVIKQSTIDIANVALKSDVEDAIGSAIHLKGTVGPSGADVTALPTSNVKIGDAYLVKGVSSPPNTTILSGSSVENGDLIIATATTPSWTVIQNNVDATRIVSRIKGTGDNWISVTPTDYTSGDVTLSVTHSGPSVTGATVGPAGNKTLDLAGSTFTVPKLTFDSHGHITAASNITYTMPTHSTPPHYNLLFNNNAGTTVDTYKPTTSPNKTLKAGTDLEISAASNVITITHSGTGRNKTSGLYKITTDARGHVTATENPSTDSVSTTVGMKYVELKTDADDLNATWLGTIGTGATTTQLLSSATGTFVTV